MTKDEFLQYKKTGSRYASRQLYDLYDYDTGALLQGEQTRKELLKMLCLNGSAIRGYIVNPGAAPRKGIYKNKPLTIVKHCEEPILAIHAGTKPVTKKSSSYPPDALCSIIDALSNRILAEKIAPNEVCQQLGLRWTSFINHYKNEAVHRISKGIHAGKRIFVRLEK